MDDTTSTPEIPPAAVAAVNSARDSPPIQAGAGSDFLLPPATSNYLVSASARTSYTRVDLSNPDAGEAGQNPVDMEGDRNLQPAQGAAMHDQSQEPQELEPAVPHEPQVSLTFLLVSGQRKTVTYDAATTIVRVKELVWNGWPSEWQEERPPSPSYLRVLYLGKILQDDDTLIKVGFPTHTPASSQSSPPPTPPPCTIVHLSIRAYAPPGSEDAPKKGRRRRSEAGGVSDEGANEGAGCCSSCVIC